MRLGYNPSTRKYLSWQYPQCLIQKTTKSAIFARFGTILNQTDDEASQISRREVLSPANPAV